MKNFKINLENAYEQFSANYLWCTFWDNIIKRIDLYIPSISTWFRNGYPWITPKLKKKQMQNRDRMYKKSYFKIQILKNKIHNSKL